ncbi:MAG: amidohydrolase [Demequina sp.]
MADVPSLVLRRARIVGGSDTPVDVTLDEGRIASIGPAEPASNAEVIDLDGRFLMPGMWDNHVHFTQWSRMRVRLDVSRALTAAHAAAMVGERLTGDSATSTPLNGFGFRDALWPDFPTAEALDAVAPHRPVILISGDLHSVWVNTAAQEHYGLVHSGLLREEEAFAVQALLAELDHDERHVLTHYAVEEATSRGLVGLVDLEMEDNVLAWEERISDGVRALRVEAGFYRRTFEEMIDRGHFSGQVIDGTDGLLTVGPLKIISDGSLNTRTAYCHDPYPGTADYGINNVPPEELEGLMELAVEHGFTVAIHAIGDLANTLALDAFEATGARGSIEHAQLLQPEDIARFVELGITASVQPEHALDDRDVADSLWAGRTDRAFLLASLHRAGVSLALGSDAPVAVLDPWVSLAAAVQRTRDEREPWYPDEQLTREVALHASTRGACIEPGALADLTAVEHDPLTAPADALRTMPVAATVVAGRLTHRDLD